MRRAPRFCPREIHMDASVIVVGAGPAGLMLAGELRLGGVDVMVLEQLPQRTGESRGLGFTARTMEVFDQRGILPAFGPVETSTQGTSAVSRSTSGYSKERTTASKPFRSPRPSRYWRSGRSDRERNSCGATRSGLSRTRATTSSWRSRAPTGPAASPPATSSAATADAAPSARRPGSTSPAPPPTGRCSSPTSAAARSPLAPSARRCRSGW